MNFALKGNLIKNIASAFINGLITLALLLIAPLGLASVIFNTLAVTISTFFVTMSFDLVAWWLIKPHRQEFFDRPLDQENFKPSPLKPQQTLPSRKKRDKDR